MPQKNQYATANNNDYEHVKRSDITFGGIDGESDAYMDRVSRGDTLGHKTTGDDGALPGQHIDREGAYYTEEFQYIHELLWTQGKPDKIKMIEKIMTKFSIPEEMAMSALDTYIKSKITD